MKKLYFYLVILITSFGFCLSVNAQTTIAEGLIKVSDETNEYWYYIENGHTSKTVVANADGRFGALITSNGGHAAGVKASIDMIHPNEDRIAQRWKVVPVPDDAGYYYLINQKGEYLHLYNKITYGDLAENVPDLTADGVKFTIDQWTTSPYYTSIRVKNAAYNLVGNNGGGSSAWEIAIATSAGSLSTIEFGTTANPRSWRFVPVEELDSFFPRIYPQGTNATDITEWFFIKSLNPSQAANPYLTVNGSTLQLSANKTAAAVYGFVGNGKAPAGNPTNGGSISLIIPKADISQYVNATGISATSYNWWLKHVIAPAISSVPQATITNGRTTTSYSLLVTSSDNTVSLQKADATNTGDNATVSTYNNQYAWTYEKAYIVDVDAGSGVTIVSPEAATAYAVEYGAPFTLSFTIGSHYKLSAGNVTIDGLPVTPTETDGTYTIQLASVTASTTQIKIQPTVELIVESTLGNIAIDGTTISGFSPETTTYNIELPWSSTTDYPAIAYTKADENATVDIAYNPASFNPEIWNTAVITVTGAPTTTIYKLNFHRGASLSTTADTYVKQGESNRSTASDLLVQYSSGAQYIRRAYLEFNPSTVDMTGYDRVSLRLAVKSIQNKTGNPTIEVRTVPETFNSIETMTFASNSETTTAQGDVVSENYVISKTAPSGSIIKVDVTDFIKNNADKTSLRLQVSGVGTEVGTYDGNMFFYSLEGALEANNINLTPALVFEKTNTITVDGNSNFTIQSPDGSSPYTVVDGAPFELKFTVASGYQLTDVKINDVLVEASQLTQSEGVYTLTIASVTEDSNITITTGILSSLVDEKQSQALVYSDKQALVIKTDASKDVEVYTISGVLVSKETINGTRNIALKNGVYLVKIDDKVYKIAL